MAAPSTFERYRHRLEAYRLVETGALSEPELSAAISEIDAALAGIAGKGISETPFEIESGLASAVGLDASIELWVKDETGTVSGSHKARHLFGVALALRLARFRDPDGDPDPGRLAIASCGNAALAAAVLARAVNRPLDVFVPTWADPGVVKQIEDLAATVLRCPRRLGELGDPAHNAVLEAISGGAVPFSCQGSSTPTAIDGGRTLVWEMLDRLVEHSAAATTRLDRLFVQVGGGALGTAVVTGLAASSELREQPLVHAVQVLGNHPLVRAWDRVVVEIAGGSAPTGNGDRRLAAQRIGRAGRNLLRGVADRLSSDPDRYMTPWETEPVSRATGILDDVTYDWTGIVEAMLRTGGHPLVVSEQDLRHAHELAHRHTNIPVCPTGVAGLAGLLALHRDDASAIAGGERVALLFTGRMRPGDPDPLA